MSRSARIEVLLAGRAYAYAVEQGWIRQGDPLPVAELFGLTRAEVREYLQQHPLPGIDCDLLRFRGSCDGLKCLPQGEGYAMGWQERGMFTPERVVASKEAARPIWIELLIGALGLPPERA